MSDEGLQGPYGEIARTIAGLDDNAEAWRAMQAWLAANVPRQPGWWRAAAQLIWQERRRLRTGAPTDEQLLQQAFGATLPPADDKASALAEMLSRHYDDGRLFRQQVAEWC